MEELNICKLFILLNQPTTQPAYQPKVKNAHNFAIFQPIWLKFGLEFLHGKTQYMYVIFLSLSILSSQLVKPTYHPTSLPSKK